MKIKTKKLADMAMFLAVGIVLNIASFPSVGFFGRVSLVYTICYLSGIFFSPISAFLVCFLADMLPALMLPQGGAWMPLISVSIGTIAFIVSICVRCLPLKFEFRFVIGIVASYLLCTCFLTPLGEVVFFDMFPYTFAKTLGRSLGIKSKLLMLMLSKAITQSFWVVLNSIISYAIYVRVFKKLNAPQIIKQLKTDNCNINDSEIIDAEILDSSNQEMKNED